MKILHTGDWHIGKLVNGVHMTEDQRFILEHLINLIKKEKPDVLIIAGDIYDRSIPPTDAVKLLDECFAEILIKNKTKIIGIAGNHDSPNRLAFGSQVFKEQGLFLKGEIKDIIEPIVIDNAKFYLIPYVEPSVIKENFGEKNIKSHDDAIKFLIDSIELDPEALNICIAHGFITNSDTIETSDSVRPLSIGGSEYVNVDYFEAFDYTALGHLHRPQKVKHDFIRYSGSLLKYSFSEVNQQKKVTLVEFENNNFAKFTEVSLPIKRDLKVLEGTLSEVISLGKSGEVNTDHYYKIVLTDEGQLIEPMAKLRQVFDHVLKLEFRRTLMNNETTNTSADKNFEKKSNLELFQNFYENMTDKPFDPKRKELTVSLLDDLNKERRKK
jgi:exonuclease SbcD